MTKPVATPRKKTAATAKKPATGDGPAAKKRRQGYSFPNYQAALKYLFERTDVEKLHMGRIDPKVFKLDRMAKLMDLLGNPHESLRCIHVAGTNGKGSVVAMLGSCLRECGYTVGTYTSPHLTDIRERIVINGQPISHHFFTDLAGRVAEAEQQLPERLGPATFFELITALGLLHFADQAVDVAVIEVGLGGKLDSTNVINPEVSIVTAIDFDHTQILGKTLPAIAEQKAGIFKKGAAALTIQQPAGVVDVMRAAAAAVGTTLQVVGTDIEFSYRFEANPPLGPHMRVGLSTDRVTYEHVPVPLPGEHQALNCGLVLAAIEKLMERGFELPSAKVVAGLEKTTIPGRMELASREPRILLDGAHNPGAVAALMKSIGAHVPYDSMVVIFGCAADKDIDEMLKRLAGGADKVIFTRAQNTPRAADPRDLLRRFTDQTGKMGQLAENFESALTIARRAAGREDLICVTGSFYLVGEAKKLIEEKKAKPAVQVEATDRAAAMVNSGSGSGAGAASRTTRRR